jgi:hypothetical protein
MEKDIHIEVIEVKEEREKRKPWVGFRGRSQRKEVFHMELDVPTFHTHLRVTVETVMNICGS